ncbi:MAG: ATP-binding protein [Deltaproteobacteria bacterium]
MEGGDSSSASHGSRAGPLALWLDRVRSRSFTRLALLVFSGMDFTFKCLVVAAYQDLIDSRPLAGTTAPLTLSVGAAALATVLWLGVLHQLARPVDAWQRSERDASLSDEEVRRMGAELPRIPKRMTLAWAAQWVGLFAFLFAWGNPPRSWWAAGFFLGAMALGPPPLAHSLAIWLLGPTARQHSLLARARGIEAPALLVSLGRRLALYNLCVAVAPTFYMAAAAFTAATGQIAVSHLLTTTLIFLAGVAVFAVLCAGLLSSTVTGPVAEMSAVMRDIIRRGDVSKVGRVPQFEADEVGALAELTNRMLDRLEIATTEKAAATSSLAVLNRELELRVAERTAELSARTADMRLVLDNVNEGLFTIDHTGVVSSEHSATLSGWFGSPEPGQAFFQYLGRRAPDFGLATQLAWDQVRDGLLPLELTLEQMPQRLSLEGRHYDVDYQSIGAGEAGRFLIVVSDRTADLEAESAQREGREAVALFEHVLADRSGLVAFLREASLLVSELLSPAPRDLGETKRAIHTLKGNALLFGLESVADLCHELESSIAQEQAAPPAQLATLWRRWARLENQVERLLGDKRQVIEMSPEQHVELERAAREGAPRDALVGLIEALRLEPVELRLRQFAEQARQLAQRLDKRVHVEVMHDGLRLDPIRWAGFWSVFVHAVRNAVDHGIEPASARSVRGKPELARIALRARVEGDRLVFEVEDDGRGVDWEEIRKRCLSQGLPAATQTDLVAALFADGLSTALEVTAISGRGIGMGALQAEVDQLGGKLEIVSQAQRGTRLRMLFPATLLGPARLRTGASSPGSVAPHAARA